MDLDSGLLRALVAVADEGHFGRAAERLAISQQGLSKRIRRLETELGVELFDRSSRRVEPTDVGRRLLPHARAALDAVDAAVAVTRSDRRPLRVAALDERLAPLQLLRRAAGLDLEVVTGSDVDDAVAACRRGDVDVTFGWAGLVPPPWPADLRRRLVALEEIWLLAPADHPLATRDGPVSTAELRGRELWFPSTSAPQAWVEHLREWSADLGLRLDPTGSVLGFDGFVTAVAGGRLSLYGSLMADLPTDRVVAVPVVEPVPLVAWWLLWRRRVTEDWVAELTAALAGRPDGVRLADDGTWWLPRRDRTWL